MYIFVIMMVKVVMMIIICMIMASIKL